jgi:2Fe-2S ferredoxin
MPTVTAITADGRKHTLDIPPGTSLMQAAVNAGIAEIVAECGGSMMCATCHVYIDDAFAEVCPPMSPTEDAMLDSVAAERRPTSRLSCQLVMNEAMSGLVVNLPERQT